MDSLFTPENFNKICQDIITGLPKDSVLSKEIKLEIVEKLKEFNGDIKLTVDYFIEFLNSRIIRNIIYNTKTVIISLEKYRFVYLESIRFTVKIFNIDKKIGIIEPGYYTIKTMQDELDFNGIKNRTLQSEQKIILNEQDSVLSPFFENFRFIDTFYYITVVIPQLNWKKEIPISNGNFYSFSIDELVKIPASSSFENKLNILFSCGSRQLEPNEIFFNVVYELRKET